jgi:predicted alpha-1,2-mannosidase
VRYSTIKRTIFLAFAFVATGYVCFGQLNQHIIWNIGIADRKADEFALAPGGYKDFIKHDFGFEDKFFLIGHSKEKNDFPYVLPGPVDTWGGTWTTAGWRANQVNILFGINQLQTNVQGKLVIKLSDYAKKFLPLIKVSINNQDEYIQLTANGYEVDKQPRPKMNEPGIDTLALQGDLSGSTSKTIEIPIKQGTLKTGGNHITITVLQGSWIMFDQIQLEATTNIILQKPGKLFVDDVKGANYELIANDKRMQPLLVSCRYLSGLPRLRVELDGKQIFAANVEQGQYEFEAPMPAVTAKKQSLYQIFENNKVIESGTVTRIPHKLQTPADYIDTRMGTAHSRWMIAPGPWMPFSMVKMSPDNQNNGWQAGYDPIFESIGTFSHIHEWTTSGLGIFATNGKLKITVGDDMKPGSGYRSAIDKRSEEAPIGYYKAQLKDYDIKAEVTATIRCGLERFTFHKGRDSARVLLDLRIPAEYNYQLKDISFKRVNEHRIEGTSHQYTPWTKDADQDYTIHFVVEFDQPIQSIGGWLNGEVKYSDSFAATNPTDAGMFVQFDAKSHPVVQVRSSISMVSTANASENLETEISKPFGWDFDAVRQNQLNVWNNIFNRVKITTPNRLDKERFYNSLYRSICSRNTWSDVNGQWSGTDGKIQQFKNKNEVALGGDAFWNTFWNLNQLWNLVTPEWSSRWVKSQLAMYDAYGWLAKGPARMNYMPIMVAEHEIPQMISAWQMGIRDFNAAKVLEAAIKMQTTPGQKIFHGYGGDPDLATYLQYHYVPSDKGRFSNSMEFSFDDWTVGQMAKTLGKTDLYKKFNDRGYWWKNVMDTAGYSHLKLSNGEWVKDFDHFKSGANKMYVEGNAWQLSFFVPQDIPALINTIGKKQFIDRLEWGFKLSEPWRYNGMNDQYWNYPIVQGNEQSMHFSFLFNWAGKPWLTQKWSRSVLERFYGYNIANAYLGDEDQGQMSAWLVMVSMGLFQTDGGTRINPIYEIGSPLFEKIEIDLGKRFGRGEKFSVIAKGASRINMYVQKATLNGKALNSFYFPAAELLKGGSLVLEMGPQPNTNWGTDKADTKKF